MNVYRANGCLVTQAPAKVNLFFEVLARRSDGFHEIETLMCPIRLFDTLSLASDPSGKIHFSGVWALGLRAAGGDGAHATDFGELPQGRENLVVRALEVLREQAGVDAGARVRLIKRIPAQAGLGGGSSDAAAALVLANQAWDLRWSCQQLMELAASLGSDVPFFLLNSPALCRGRGEKIEQIEGLPVLHIVVVRPPAGLSTAAVYRACHVPASPKASAPLIESLRKRPAWIGETLHNALQPAAEALSPWINRLKQEFAATDCVAHQMSGSGSSYFGVCRHARHANRIANSLRSKGIGRVYALTSTTGQNNQGLPGG
jgi:4-diphosphocytidyl-2-C-methyl-D-erythritol kinase